MELRYRVEEEKSLIYDSHTDKDICVYFSEEGKNLLLKSLNSQNEQERKEKTS